MRGDIFRRIILILAVAITFGAAYSLIYASFMPKLPSVGGLLKEEGIIVNYPKEGLSYSIIEVNSNRNRILARIPPFPEYQRGDKVLISGAVSGVYGRKIYLSFPEISLVKKNKSGGSVIFLNKIRSFLLSNLYTALPAENAALAAGLLLGDDSGFSKEFRDRLKTTGTIHIVALSGWNIAIIISATVRLAGLIFRRRAALVLSCLGIAFFIFLAGPSSSLIRAAIMGSVFVLASLFGREYSPRNAVVFAAAIMVAGNPAAPAYDLGFQLSFLAVIGMIYLAPAISRSLKKVRAGKIFAAAGIPESLSAQIAILPVALSGAIAVTPVSIIVNAAILFLIPFAFLFSLLAALAGGNLGILSWAFSFGANILLSYEINAINLFGLIF